MKRLAFCILNSFIWIYAAKGQGQNPECPPSCPNGWVTFDESCYYFGRGQGMTFNNASKFCVSQNSYLLHVNDARENNFVKDYLYHLVHSYYWMGLTDEQTEGTFTWINDNSAPGFTDWAPGEPHSITRPPHEHDIEDCGAFFADHSHQWDDIRCEYTGAIPICEMSFGDIGAVIG